MNEIAKALEALDRIFNCCEEIDLHLPKEEQEGYDMLVDINIIREVLINQTSIIAELEKIKAKIGKLEYLNIEDGSGRYDKYIEQYEVLNIIDRYKAESEDKE